MDLNRMRIELILQDFIDVFKEDLTPGQRENVINFLIEKNKELLLNEMEFDDDDDNDDSLNW